MRGLVLSFIAAVAFGAYILSFVELYLKFAFDNNHVECARFLALRETVNGAIRCITNNVQGKLSDMIGRKPFFYLWAYAGGFSIFFFSIAAETPSLLKYWGWISIILDAIGGIFIPAIIGYMKDIVPSQVGTLTYFACKD